MFLLTIFEFGFHKISDFVPKSPVKPVLLSRSERNWDVLVVLSNLALRNILVTVLYEMPSNSKGENFV